MAMFSKIEENDITHGHDITPDTISRFKFKGSIENIFWNSPIKVEGKHFQLSWKRIGVLCQSSWN